MDIRTFSTFLHSTTLLSLTLRFTPWKPSFHLRQMIGLLYTDTIFYRMLGGLPPYVHPIKNLFLCLQTIRSPLPRPALS